MGATTGIKWTDSTYNSWWGCTKVGPACDDCYAEGTDKRAGGGHWGHGAERRLLSEKARNEPFRWQRQADAFEAEYARRRRVFTLSMGDLFDNEVPSRWRSDHMHTMEMCDRLDWQVCTKRVSNLSKMSLPGWKKGGWPKHIGVLVTVVTQKEAERDLPRLLDLKTAYNIPWVGVSNEPAQEWIDWSPFLDWTVYGTALDWLIFGGKSGGNWKDRPFSLDWAREARQQCTFFGTAFFFKQVAAFRPTDDMIPADLLVRQCPLGGRA
ncbi:MAG: DUF5131 family protein [Rhizobiaceae bacterium]